MTAGRTANQSEPGFELGFTGRFAVERRAEQAETTRMGVDDTDAHRDARDQPELARGHGRQRTDPLAHRTHAVSDARVLVARQIFQTDLREKVVRPATFMTEV